MYQTIDTILESYKVNYNRLISSRLLHFEPNAKNIPDSNLNCLIFINRVEFTTGARLAVPLFLLDKEMNSLYAFMFRMSYMHDVASFDSRHISHVTSTTGGFNLFITKAYFYAGTKVFFELKMTDLFWGLLDPSRRGRTTSDIFLVGDVLFEPQLHTELPLHSRPRQIIYLAKFMAILSLDANQFLIRVLEKSILHIGKVLYSVISSKRYDTQSFAPRSCVHLIRVKETFVASDLPRFDIVAFVDV